MSSVLARWNVLAPDAAADEILPCCGSRAWAQALVARRPLADVETLFEVSDEIWLGLAEADWLEAFRSHPRIGGTEVPTAATAQSVEWSAQEQSSVAKASDSAKLALEAANGEYERRFHRIFIVCAMGRSPEEILALLRRRLANDEPAELQEAAEQQRQIAQVRLRKWLQG